VAWTGGRLEVRLDEERRARPRDEAPAVRAEQAWDPDGRLTLRGRLEAAECELVLRHLDGWDTRTAAVEVAAGGGFRAAVPVAAMEAFGATQPLRDGRWDITLRGPDGPVDAGAFAVDGRPVRLGPKVYRCAPGAGGTGVRLVVGPALGVTERGRVRRGLLREIYYRVQRLLPVRDAILFSSFHGKQCGDNPRAIADELRGRGDRRQNIWAINDWSVPVPAETTAVLIGTRRYFSALARSKYLVYNDHVPLPYRKRRGQRHVQTWHGTPLKRLGYDIGEPKMASGQRYLDYMAGDVAQWDLLLSPNPFSTPIMRKAFRFAGEIGETGYPRNDALVAAAGSGAGGSGAGASAGRGAAASVHAVAADLAAGAGLAAGADRAAAIRRRLGLPAGKRVAMYVPTWRDNQHDEEGRYLLDFRLDLDAASVSLAAGWVLLVRGHHLMTGGVPEAAGPGFAFDVTGYPDIGDLLLVTDVLITDYSSVMFDFAPTGRPMLFFTYDLEQYRDRLRGFYFDFEAAAPGPLLASSGRVVDALADIDSVAAKYAASLAAFTARFCPLDDGKASARACDLIFGAEG